MKNKLEFIADKVVTEATTILVEDASVFTEKKKDDLMWSLGLRSVQSGMEQVKTGNEVSFFESKPKEDNTLSSKALSTLYVFKIHFLDKLIKKVKEAETLYTQHRTRVLNSPYPKLRKFNKELLSIRLDQSEQHLLTRFQHILQQDILDYDLMSIVGEKIYSGYDNSSYATEFIKHYPTDYYNHITVKSQSTDSIHAADLKDLVKRNDLDSYFEYIYTTADDIKQLINHVNKNPLPPEKRGGCEIPLDLVTYFNIEITRIQLEKMYEVIATMVDFLQHIK